MVATTLLAQTKDNDQETKSFVDEVEKVKLAQPLANKIECVYPSADKVRFAEPSIEDVIEEMGFGLAQLKQVFLAGIVQFMQGIHLGLVSVLTVPLAAEFALGFNQKALGATLIHGGMFVGACFSGPLGDRMGRRFAVCVTVVVVTISGCATPFLPSWGLICVARFVDGVGIALGHSPAITLLSEITPGAQRIMVRSVSDGMFDVGYTIAALVATLYDPNLKEMPWRAVQLIAAVPAGVIALFTLFFLAESPLFLASRGRHQEAQRILESMRRANGGGGDDPVCYQLPQGPAADEPGLPGGEEGSGGVFSRRFMLTTLILAYSSFLLNVFYYGGLFAQPQVMHKSGGSLAPGWDIVIGGGPGDAFGLVLVVVATRWLAQRTVLVLAFVTAASATLAFGYSASLAVRSPWQEVVYQFGVMSFYWVPAVGFVVLYQLAVAVYPTAARATGCGVAMAAGRLGGLVSPLIFENVWKLCGHWSVFFHVVSVGALSAAALTLFIRLPPPQRGSPGERTPLVPGEEDSLSA